MLRSRFAILLLHVWTFVVAHDPCDLAGEVKLHETDCHQFWYCLATPSQGNVWLLVFCPREAYATSDGECIPGWCGGEGPDGTDGTGGPNGPWGPGGNGGPGGSNGPWGPGGTGGSHGSGIPWVKGPPAVPGGPPSMGGPGGYDGFCFFSSDPWIPNNQYTLEPGTPFGPGGPGAPGGPSGWQSPDKFICDGVASIRNGSNVCRYFPDPYSCRIFWHCELSYSLLWVPHKRDCFGGQYFDYQSTSCVVGECPKSG